MEQQQHAQGDIVYRDAPSERLRDLHMAGTVVADDRERPLTLAGLARSRPIHRLARWVFRPLCFGGLVAALIFFWISLTPSLLPRTWLFQGIVSGLSASAGYGIGSMIQALMRRFAYTESKTKYKRYAWVVLAVVAVLGSGVLLWQAHRWQNELRALVGLGNASNFRGLGVVLVTAITGGVVLVAARLIRYLTRSLIHEADRYAPRWVSVAVGVLLAAVVVVGIFQDVVWRSVVEVVNQASSVTNETTSEGTERPTTSNRSGGPGSLVAWGDLGRQGRDFVGLGPTVRDLEAFHGAGCCAEPIRVYVGIDSAASAKERAALAVQELERTGAFDRDVLGIFTATGTGWVDETVADSLEYVHRGDTAEVSMQYSFLPSWVSFLVDQTKAEEAGQELIGAVVRRVDELPPAERPRVLVFGESLGSYGTEQAFDDLADMRAQVDGALLVGPTFANPIHKQLTDARNPGSPEWLPTLPAGTGAFFARTPADLAGVAENGVAPRVVYLQNASDPITWWSPELAYRKPDWAGLPAPPDRSPAFRWFPIVTFCQVGIDLVNSLGVPAGHGHYFGSNVVDGWVAVAKPDGWSDEQTQRLRQIVLPLDE